MIFLSCFFEFLKKNSSIYKNSPKKKIGILTIVGQYFCFQIYEVGELGNHPQERTSPKFGRGK